MKKLVLPGKHVCRCSVRASCVTGLLEEFMAEIANSNTSPKGMNCDWLIGDILMGDTSPVKKKQKSVTVSDTGLKSVNL